MCMCVVGVTHIGDDKMQVDWSIYLFVVCEGECAV